MRLTETFSLPRRYASSPPQNTCLPSLLTIDLPIRSGTHMNSSEPLYLSSEIVPLIARKKDHISFHSLTVFFPLTLRDNIRILRRYACRITRSGGKYSLR